MNKNLRDESDMHFQVCAVGRKRAEFSLSYLFPIKPAFHFGSKENTRFNAGALNQYPTTLKHTGPNKVSRYILANTNLRL